MRQEILHLVHHIDAQIVAGQPAVHVHAADDHTAADAGEILGDGVIAIAVGRFLLVPRREGVGGGRNRGDAVFSRDTRDGPAHVFQFAQRVSRFAADRGADFNLALQEFWAHLAAEHVLTLAEKAWWLFGDQIAGFEIDEEIFLLDAEGEVLFRGAVCACVLFCHPVDMDDNYDSV